LLSDALSGTVDWMPKFWKASPSILLALVCVQALLPRSGVRARPVIESVVVGPPHSSPVATASLPAGDSTPAPSKFLSQDPAAAPVPTDPRTLYQALNDLRPDAKHVYEVHDLTLRRDVTSFTFTEGKLAFFQPLGGRITGAIFSGRGRVIATPHDPGERRSLAQFVGVPILDQVYSDAYIRFTDDSAREIEEQLKSSGAEPVDDPALAEQWRSYVAVLAPAQSLRIMTDWLSAEPLPYFYALLHGASVGPFEVSVDQRRREQVLIGQPRVSNGAAAYDIWSLFPAEDAPQKPIEIFEPVDYRVDSTIGDDLALEGKTTLHLKAIRGGERVVSLELSRNLSVKSVQDENGEPLVYFQNEELSRRNIARRGNDSVLVILPAAVSAGKDFRLDVSYHGNVIADAGNGVEYVGERGTWYAHLGGEHFADFDLSFRWPKRLTLVATGMESEAREDGEVKSGRWRSDAPFATAGFNLSEYKTAAATGRPRVQVFANQLLEDAIVKRLRMNARVQDAVNSLEQYSASHELVEIPEPPPPTPSSALSQVGSNVRDSIRYLEKMNGDFPFDHLDVTQIPGSFGQGWPELVYLSTLAFLPAETAHRAGLTEWTQEAARELMPCHEIAHQWWGNVTGAASYRDVWIQEGLANYLALLYADSKKPNEHYLTRWLDHYRAELSVKPAGTNQPVDEIGPLVLGSRLTSPKAPDAYETLLYGKSTWVMHMLRQMMLDPGAKDPDERFRELLRGVLSEYRFRTLSTADFQRAVEQHMSHAMDLEGNRKMDWFFDQWVRGTGMPRYAVKFESKPRGQEYAVSGKLEQNGVGDVFTAPVPLYAVAGVGKPQLLGTVVTTGPETRFHFTSRIRPAHILIDPNNTVLWRKE
jgi:Peptidase family M1 domain